MRYWKRKRPNYEEVLDYINEKGVTGLEAYNAFCRMHRRPLTRTMKAVYRRLDKSQWGWDE